MNPNGASEVEHAAMAVQTDRHKTRKLQLTSSSHTFRSVVSVAPRWLLALAFLAVRMEKGKGRSKSKSMQARQVLTAVRARCANY